VTPDDRAAMAHLARVIGEERRQPVRALALVDFRERALRARPSDAKTINAIAAAATPAAADIASALVEHYLAGVAEPAPATDVDLLLLTVKPVELEAMQVVLGRTIGEPGDVPQRSGRHYFDGQLDSGVAGRPLTYTLACLHKQGNARAGVETRDILADRKPRLAVLVGMAAGHPKKVQPGDVVGAELVVYVAPGTRTDDGIVTDPDPLRPPEGIGTEMAAARPQHHAWPERYASAVAAASAAGLTLPTAVPGARPPTMTTGAVVSDELKDETTRIASMLDAHTGDAKAYDMESGGFAQACQRAGVDWLVFRGVADFGVKLDDDGQELPRDKSWQLAATMSAGTAVLAWLTGQSLVFGRVPRTADGTG